MDLISSRLGVLAASLKGSMWARWMRLSLSRRRVAAGGAILGVLLVSAGSLLNEVAVFGMGLVALELMFISLFGLGHVANVVGLAIATAGVCGFFFAAKPRDPKPERCADGLTAAAANDPDPLRVPDHPGPPHAEDPVDVKTRPAALAVGHEGVWVGGHSGVSLVNARERRLSGTAIDVGGDVYSLALSRDRVWAVRRDGFLIEIDRHKREVVDEPRSVTPGSADVAVGFGSVWVNAYVDDRKASAQDIENYDGRILRIDPCTRAVESFEVGAEADTVRIGHDSVWITDAQNDELIRFDPDEEAVSGRERDLLDPTDIAFTETEVWVTEYYEGSVRRVGAASARVRGTRIPVVSEPGGIAIGAGAVWVPSWVNGYVARVDLDDREPNRHAVKAGDDLTDAAVGHDRVWVAPNKTNTIVPIRP